MRRAARIPEPVAPAFYPPRARWFSPLCNAGYVLRERLHLGALRLPRGLGPGGFALAALVPGYAFSLFGRPRLGWALTAAYGLALAVLVVWLGHGVASLAMGGMISIHVASLLHLLDRWPAPVTPRRRVARALGVAIGVGGLIYLPAQWFVENHLFLPLRIHDRVLIVAAGTRASTIARGDLIAFRIPAGAEDHARRRAGFGLGRVEALSGERITFEEEGYVIGLVRRPLRPYMPKAEAWVVPEKHWFVWPDSGMRASGAAAEGAALMRELALVPEARLVGKAFPRWFGRSQVEP